MRKQRVFCHLAVAVVATLWLARPAEASFIINFAQSGPNVVATGSGSFNLSAFGELLSISSQPQLFLGNVEPNQGLALGYASSEEIAIHFGRITGPDFGPGGNAGYVANSGAGTFVSFGYTSIDSSQDSSITLPPDYVFGTAISDSSTWNNTTFAALGLTPGTYLYSLGSGASADTITVNVQSAAPEPGSMAFIAMGGLGLALLRPRKRA